jgi:hypothetical protein
MFLINYIIKKLKKLLRKNFLKSFFYKSFATSHILKNGSIIATTIIQTSAQTKTIIKGSIIDDIFATYLFNSLL